MILINTALQTLVFFQWDTVTPLYRDHTQLKDNAPLLLYTNQLCTGTAQILQLW